MAALESIASLGQRHGFFGLGFSTSWLQERGAAPVWYVVKGSAFQTELFEIIQRLAFQQQADPADPLWKLTPFIDYPQEPAEGEGPSTYDWRWEREWRVRGDLSFDLDAVRLLFAPAADHERVRAWWNVQVIDGFAELIPPIVDANWSRSQIDDVVRSGPATARLPWDSSDGPLEVWPGDDEASPFYLDPLDEGERGRADLQEEVMRELSGWLDEMARDDI